MCLSIFLGISASEEGSEDDDKYKCAHCTCSFRKLGSLNAHISRFHPDEVEDVLEKEEPAEQEDDDDKEVESKF